MSDPIAGIIKIFLFQKSNIEAEINTELMTAVTTSSPPILSCSFNTNIERTKEDMNARSVYVSRERPILRNELRRR